MYHAMPNYFSAIQNQSSTLIRWSCRCRTELFNGEPSKSSTEHLNTLNMDTYTPAADPEVSYLAATNYLVDLHNSRCLNKLEGQLFKFISLDNGSRRILDTISSVKRVLFLKLEALVIVTAISDSVSNGERGVVKRVQQDTIAVLLLSGKTVYINMV